MGELRAFVNNNKKKITIQKKKIHFVSVVTKIYKRNSQFSVLLVSLLLSSSQNQTSFVLLLLLLLFEQLIKTCV